MSKTGQQGIKRPLEAPQSSQESSKRYQSVSDIRNLAKAESSEMEMMLGSASNSAAASRRSSISSLMDKDLTAISSFKGNAFGSANSFKPLGGLPPVHSLSKAPDVLQRPETGGVTAKVQSLLNEYTGKVDEKIKAAVKPISEAQAVAGAQIALISTSVKQIESNVQSQPSEHEERISQSFEGSTAQMRKRIEENAANQSQRLDNVADSAHKAHASIIELISENTELRQDTSDKHERALAAVRKAEESSSSKITQLELEIIQKISASAEQTKVDMQDKITNASKILETKAATNLDIAINTLESRADNKISDLKQEIEDNLARIQIDSIALYERFNQNSQSEINELKQKIVTLNERADEADHDHVKIRDSVVKALIGLKGHLLTNTKEFIAYKEDYSEHDTKRLELFLEIKMYDEIKDFVKEFAPNLTEVLSELKSTAEQNLEITSNHYDNIDQAAALFEINHSASASAACDEDDETNSYVGSDLQLTDFTIPLTGNSGYGSEESE